MVSHRLDEHGLLSAAIQGLCDRHKPTFAYTKVGIREVEFFRLPAHRTAGTQVDRTFTLPEMPEAGMCIRYHRGRAATDILRAARAKKWLQTYGGADASRDATFLWLYADADRNFRFAVMPSGRRHTSLEERGFQGSPQRHGMLEDP